MPRFLIQIVDGETGQVVVLPGGGRVERDLIVACTDAAVARGVGFLRTEAHVRWAIDGGITDAVRALKREMVRVA